MAKYLSHNHWRIRFLAGEGDVYSLRNLQFRRFSTADPVNSCGTVEECRAGAEQSLTYNEQAEGTRATDLFLYGGGGAFDAGWVSLQHPTGLPDDIFIAREYLQGRDVSYVGLIAAVGDAPATRISRFVIEYSDDGVNWIASREFETNPVWGRGEERVFALPNADSYLPVFSFRPNRKEPLSEKLAFLTDVLRSSRGAEQRRSLRPTPRRTFETDFLLTGRERTFWDLFFNRLSGGEVTIPLYWETVTTKAALVADVTKRVNFDTTNTEWAYAADDLAILMGKTALDYEVVQITTVDANGINLALPVSRPWPKGTKLLPLRRGVIDDISEPAHKSAGVATVTAQFRITVANPWTPDADDSPVYEGLPVFLEEPNWVDDLTMEYGREITSFDPGVGLPFQTDSMGRALIGQAHRWFLTGRERLAKFRDLIYRHQGRAGSFWLPTFKADFNLVADIAETDIQIEVENVGYFYTGGPTSGREYIAIKHGGGTILRKVVTVFPGSTPATELLGLDAPVGLALSTGQVRRISFADVARFDTDEFEIVHHGGIDAHHSASAVFRTFKNTRTAPEPISDPIPVGSMNTIRCGEWTERAICFALDWSTSMDTNNRFETMKAAMVEVLELLSSYTSGYEMDLSVTIFGDPGSTITRRSATATGVNEMISFVQGLSTGASDTDFRTAANAAAAFFNGTSPAITDRYFFMLTDGEPTDNGGASAMTIATQAAATLNALALPVQRYGINIDLADTTYTAMIDNTPSDGVPVIEGSDTSAFVDAVLGAF